MIEIGSSDLFQSEVSLPKVKIKIGESLVVSQSDSIFGERPVIVYRFVNEADLQQFKNLVQQFNNILS